MDYAARLKRIREAMRLRGIGLMYLHPGANMFYATGVMRGSPELTDHNAYGDLVSGAYVTGESVILVAPPRPWGIHFEAQAEGKPWIKQVRLVSHDEKPRAVAAEVVKALRVRGKVSVDDRAWASGTLLLQRELPGSVFEPASDVLAPMRMVKDRDEVEAMRRAAAITDEAYGDVVRFLRVGQTPYEVAAEVNYQLARRGAETPSFQTGVRFTSPGKPRSFAGGDPMGPPLQLGDAVTFDFGACLGGYCSDFGRTCFAGEPPAEYRKVHETVLQAQSAAIKRMVGGTLNATQLDRVARGVIEKAGHGPEFVHRLGHGIGVSVHEPPYLYQPDDTTLRNGMTFTVEPSILLPGSWSNRVEDVVLVTEKGGDSLTKYPRELTVI